MPLVRAPGFSGGKGQLHAGPSWSTSARTRAAAAKVRAVPVPEGRTGRVCLPRYARQMASKAQVVDVVTRGGRYDVEVYGRPGSGSSVHKGVAATEVARLLKKPPTFKHVGSWMRTATS